MALAAAAWSLVVAQVWGPSTARAHNETGWYGGAYAIWDVGTVEGPIVFTETGWTAVNGISAGAHAHVYQPIGGAQPLRVVSVAVGVPAGNSAAAWPYRLYWWHPGGLDLQCPHLTLIYSGTISVGAGQGWYETLLPAPVTLDLDPTVCGVQLAIDMPAGANRWQRSEQDRDHHNWRQSAGAGFGATGGVGNENYISAAWAMDVVVEDDNYAGNAPASPTPTATATNTPTTTPAPTATNTPTTTPVPTATPTPPPTPAGTPMGTPGPSGHVWVDNFWEIAQPIRDLPGGIGNAFATLVVPEPTMIAAAQQTVEAATGANVANAQATAAARWQTTVDVYDTKTNFVTEIGGLLGELRDALVDAPCGDVGITISPTLMGKTLTLDFFTAEQLDVWWCPVFRPLLEAALYLLLTVSALMLWMRFRRSGGNE